MFFSTPKVATFISSPLDKSRDQTLSFCISHKDRRGFLKETLPRNLMDNADNPNVTFVLVDFSDNDLVADWILDECSKEISSGQLIAFRCDRLPQWHASLAKNTAHAAAKGDIVVNLDCDNFTGFQGGEKVINAFCESENDISLWQYSGTKLDGSYGRIAMARSTFKQLGGYNEDFLPMGFQDGDLLARAEALGVELVRDKDPMFNQAIKHGKFAPQNMTWKKMNEHNQRLSKSLIKQGTLEANDGHCNGLLKYLVPIL